MKSLTDEMECPNCPLLIPVYKVGDEGYRKCTKCGYSFHLLFGDGLLFLMTHTPAKLRTHSWKIEKVYQESDWQQEYRDLSSPKVAVYWSLMRGMSLSKITFKEKLTLESLPWEALDSKFNSYDIKIPISLWLFEFHAGLRQPDDAR